MKYDLCCRKKSKSSSSSSGTLKLPLLPCVLCLSTISDVTAQPCGHKVLCRDCCNDVTRCPICETFIMQRKAGEGVQTFESVDFTNNVLIQKCRLCCYCFDSEVYNFLLQFSFRSVHFSITILLQKCRLCYNFDSEV